MDQAVFQTLTDTLSADTNTRLAAELKLKELRINPGTGDDNLAHSAIDQERDVSSFSALK
jgi:uncharacterized protein (DUF2267 family)